jgi:hypothetical protein
LLPDGRGDKLFARCAQSAPADVETIAIGYPPGPATTTDDLLPPCARSSHGPAFFLLGMVVLRPARAARARASRPPGLRGVIWRPRS